MRSARPSFLQELLAALAALEEPYRTAVQLRLVGTTSRRARSRAAPACRSRPRARASSAHRRLRAELDHHHAGRGARDSLPDRTAGGNIGS
jgi:hypothetical protein